MVCLTVKGRLSPTVEHNALVHAPAAMTRCLALKVGPLAVTTVTTAPPGGGRRERERDKYSG